MKLIFALLGSALVVTATSSFTRRQETPECDLAGCITALAAAAPAIAACADAIKDQNDPNASTAEKIAADIDCLAEAVDSAIDIPKDCAPCVQELSL